MEIARDLGVTSKDAKTIKVSRRRTLLSGIAQTGLTILAALVGFAAGKAMNHYSEAPDQVGYPYAPILLTPYLLVGTQRRSWIAALIVATIAFLTVFFITWGLSEAYGTTPKYGVYCRR